MSFDWSIYPLPDEPIHDAKLLGLEKTVKALYNFLSSDTLITPLAIAINGEWGSGKTSFINTLKNKVDHAKDKTTIFFDAWKYEYTDPAAGLFLTITEQLSSKTKSDHLKEIAKNVGSLALDIFSRHYIGISTEEARAHFKRTVQETENLSEKLQKLVASALGDKNVIVFIDDLDRCSLENVVKILDSLKLFLNMNNFVFVVAVDMSKIKLAWSFKHGKDDKTSIEGLRYLEKIFQIETSIPVPSSDELKEYVQFLFPNMPVEFVDLISITGIRNPRSVKKLLNLISLRSSIEKEQPNILEIAFLWTIVGKGAYQMYYEAGPHAFYRFHLLPNQFRFGHRDKTDRDKARGIKDIADKFIPSSEFSDLALGNALRSNTLQSQRLRLYLLKASRIIGKIKEDDADIVKALEEVTHFSKSTQA